MRSSQGDLVMEVPTVRSRYLKSMSFVCDLIALLPIDIIQAGIGWHPAVVSRPIQCTPSVILCSPYSRLLLTGLCFAWHWGGSQRLNKLFRLWTMLANFRHLQKYSLNPAVINIIEFTRLILIWLLLPHWFTIILLLLIRIVSALCRMHDVASARGRSVACAASSQGLHHAIGPDSHVLLG